MDKYQLEVFNKISKFELNSEKGNGNIEIEKDALSLIQNENFNICNYFMEFESNAIETVKVDDETYQAVNEKFKIDIDFNNQASQIELIGKNDIIEPIVLKLKYVSANKEKYNKKLANEKRRALLEVMDATIAYGDNLINIYWNLVNDKIDKTKVTLYLDRENRFLTEKSFANDTRYASFNDLAYGSYYFVVTQYSGEKEVIESDKLWFTISKPQPAPINVNCDGGRRTVRI